ncbi:hypothetical protein MKW98_015624, partial [Papaver atlanticum]
ELVAITFTWSKTGDWRCKTAVDINRARWRWKLNKMLASVAAAVMVLKMLVEVSGFQDAAGFEDVDGGSTWWHLSLVKRGSRGRGVASSSSAADATSSPPTKDASSSSAASTTSCPPIKASA